MYIRFENNIQVEVAIDEAYILRHYPGEWLLAPEGFDPMTQTATLDSGNIVLSAKPVKTHSDVLQEISGERFVYNDDYDIGHENFRETYLFNLRGVVSNDDINNKGDIVHVKWYKGETLAIEEDRVYTRTETGTMPFEVSYLGKDTTIKFYKHNGTHVTKILPTREYNAKERKEKDQKSRTNLLEKTRELTGVFIATEQTTNGTPQNILPALAEALAMFDSLNKEINQYKFERLNDPLVNAITNYPQTSFITQTVLNYIVSLIDIEFYENIT